MKILRRLFTAAVFVLLVGWLCLPPPPPLDGVSYSRRVFDREGRLLRLTLTDDDKYRLATPLAKIAPELVDATLAREDRHFRWHPGVNPVASLRAAAHLCVGHRGRGGASTITMQLARVRYGLYTRTASGKFVQMCRALQIERHYTKDQILAAYLNLAPYGRNIEGAGAASALYFGKDAARLTRHEAVTLSALPQSPTRRALPLVAAHGFRAPHFVLRTLAGNAGPGDLGTTLDLDLQRLVERRIEGHLVAQRRRGVTNAAAMLIDTRTMDVLAQAGSADFFNESISGQVDGTRSRRSPGSTLKPFIYALAIDQGVIHPLTMLSDTPRSFGGYNPENFDGEFAGPIKATDALARSRNIPAVALAAQLARPTLYEFLKRSGVALPRDESFYGLSLPLGGAEVTMEELLRLYAALANGGRLRAIHRTPHAPEPGTRVLSPEASFLTLEMLGHVPRPGLNDEAGNEGVYWKTGTSMGFRDAWSIGVFDHYVLAVWVGNFDGHRNPAFIGRTCAGPLLFSIIDAMRSAGRVRTVHLAPPPGANLRPVEFCAVTGQLPTAACAHHCTGWFIPGVSPIAACTVHRDILIDAASGLRVSTDDGNRTLRRETYEFWPSDLLSLFEKAGIPRRRPPPFLPGAGANLETLSRAGQPPQIVSPQPHQVFALRTGDDSTVTLRAHAEADVTRLYWFADKTFLGTTVARDVFHWRPAPGSYRLLALDDHGRSGACSVTIQTTDEQTSLTVSAR